jgi:hypothetical protein
MQRIHSFDTTTRRQWRKKEEESGGGGDSDSDSDCDCDSGSMVRGILSTVLMTLGSVLSWLSEEDKGSTGARDLEY